MIKIRCIDLLVYDCYAQNLTISCKTLPQLDLLELSSDAIIPTNLGEKVFDKASSLHAV